MKPAFILLLLTISIQLAAQQTKNKSAKQVFVRIFNENGSKTHTGHLIQTTDSSIFIIEKQSSVEILSSQITTIKLKRSFGHTVLISTLIGGGVVAILGAASADPDAWIFGYTAGEGAVAGLILGGSVGAATGSIIAGTQNRPIFKINQNKENWLKARPVLDSYLNNQ